MGLWDRRRRGLVRETGRSASFRCSAAPRGRPSAPTFPADSTSATTTAWLVPALPSLSCVSSPPGSSRRVALNNRSMVQKVVVLEDVVVVVCRFRAGPTPSPRTPRKSVLAIRPRGGVVAAVPLGFSSGLGTRSRARKVVVLHQGVDLVQEVLVLKEVVPNGRCHHASPSPSLSLPSLSPAPCSAQGSLGLSGAPGKREEEGPRDPKGEVEGELK